MEERKTSGMRGARLRESVVDAAERLLRKGEAGFSMRDLAAEAGVSFATPFNQFGSKAAIMLELSARRIDQMERRFLAAPKSGNSAERVLLAVETAAAVMLEEPGVNRAVMGWLGTPGPETGQVLRRSTALWALALGAGEGLSETRRSAAIRDLPRQLAFGFRGVLSFWTAGELADDELGPNARDIANGLLRAFTD